MNVSHLKILNSFISFHGTGWSHTILNTAKTCSVAICSRSISWVVRFIYSSSWNSLWLPAWGSSYSSFSSYKSNSIQVGTCSLLSNGTYSCKWYIQGNIWKFPVSIELYLYLCYSTWCPFQSCPLSSSCNCTGISASAASTAAADCSNHIYGQWLVLNFRDIQLWGAFYFYHNRINHASKNCRGPQLCF